jgi:hypothetical protein
MEGCMEAIVLTSLHLALFPTWQVPGFASAWRPNVELHGIDKLSSVEVWSKAAVCARKQSCKHVILKVQAECDTRI